MHWGAGDEKKMLGVMDQNSVHYALNIGVRGEAFYRAIEGAKPYKKRLGIIFAPDWKLGETDKDFLTKLPDELEKAIKAGGLGMKMHKALGLTAKDTTGKLIPIDDPRLNATWERAAKLGCVIAFHVGDPKPFFEPTISPDNERYEELHLHPEWSFGDPAKYPGRDVILEQRNNVIRKFKTIKFQCVHAGNKPEDIKGMAKWFAEMPNFHIDTSARLGELGRLPVAEVNEVYTKYQDRILFGTDFQVHGETIIQGAGPDKAFTDAENKAFFQIHWRFFQTKDQQFDHPTPIQGKWKINGIGLEKTACQKIYWDNAYKLYKLDKLGVV
jgi:predicted TIM-barrel fold metal-dependent hydrolase